ncbi:MAG TPA: hypothetical protein VH684_04310 [Xanthobacteraceae bacterium]|jgi:hypothetical protein
MTEQAQDRDAREELNPRARFVCKLSSGLAYCIVAGIYLYAQSVASNVFMEACGRKLPTTPLEKVGIGLVIFLIPVVLARSKAVVSVHAIFASLAMVFALFTAFTASTPPYECYTQAGSYEDHVSGIPVFGFFLVFVAFILYFSLVLDWFVWSVRKAAQVLTHVISNMRPIR